MVVRDPKQSNPINTGVYSRRPIQRSNRREQSPARKVSPLALIHSLSNAVTGGAVIVALLAGFAFWRSGARFMDGLKLMFNPPPPEDVVDVRSVVVQQVRDASELTTAVFTMETVVPTESDRTFAGYTIGKTNLLYVAHGEVRAGIDLSELSTADVVASTNTADETILRIQLPAPQLLDSKIDVSRSQVYDYDRGFFNLGPDRAPELQSLAQQTALNQIEQAACEEGILTMASDRAELVVKQLLSSAGYAQVTVETLPAQGGSVPNAVAPSTQEQAPPESVTGQ